LVGIRIASHRRVVRHSGVAHLDASMAAAASLSPI
jgi:hypothetical protein